VLLQQISWRDALVRMPEPVGLDILPAGPSTRRASDLIGTGLAELVEEPRANTTWWCWTRRHCWGSPSRYRWRVQWMA